MKKEKYAKYLTNELQIQPLIFNYIDLTKHYKLGTKHIVVAIKEITMHRSCKRFVNLKIYLRTFFFFKPFDGMKVNF